jgi:hypothetical protein
MCALPSLTEVDDVAVNLTVMVACVLGGGIGSSSTITSTRPPPPDDGDESIGRAVIVMRARGAPTFSMIRRSVSTQALSWFGGGGGGIGGRKKRGEKKNWK